MENSIKEKQEKISGVPIERNGGTSIEIYMDADYARSVVDQRSTSRYYSFIRGNLVTWKSKKQNVVPRSNAEAEFKSVVQGICEALWIKGILDELKI